MKPQTLLQACGFLMHYELIIQGLNHFTLILTVLVAALNLPFSADVTLNLYIPFATAFLLFFTEAS